MLRLALPLLALALPLLAWQNPCATCHPAETKAFETSPMGRSVTREATQPDGQLHHQPSNSNILIRHDANGTMLQELHTRGMTAEYPIAYTVGAGKVGFSYLISIAPYLFQSPASYYAQNHLWDVTPGYEPERTLDFTHPIVEGCVFCHTNKVNLEPGTDNRFQPPGLTPISCERCHGNAANHLQNPVAGSIFNPAKMTGNTRDSVCEQCHLEGETRILNPGKDWQDFKVGDDLESVFTTYLVRVAPQEGRKAVTQYEQLALSRCARESGDRLWCGTCHNPHNEAVNRAEQVKSTCLQCHAQLFVAQKHQPAEECVSCHMPKLRPSNIAHAAITSHIISIPTTVTDKAAPPQPGTVGVTAWRPQKEFAERNLGLAIFQIASSKHDSREVLHAYEILSHLPNRDPLVNATLGSILLEQGYLPAAVRLYQQACAAEPKNARYAMLLAAALAKQGKQSDAINEFRRSIALDPSAPEPYRRLAQLYDQAGESAQSRRVQRDYLKFMPQNLEFRLPEALDKSIH